MNIWVLSGSGCLGLVIGWLVWTFVVRAPKFELKALSTIAAIVAGSIALNLWRTGKGAIPDEANFYFVGVFLSVLFLGALNYQPPPNSD